MHSPGVLFVIFLISLLSSDLINALQNDPTHCLEKKSSVDLAVELDERNSRLWDPQISISEQPDHLIFRHYLLPNFNLDSLKSSRRRFDENFSWSSVSLLSLSQYNLSYILLGGSWSKNVDTPYPREDGIVLLCNFTLSESGQLKFAFPCHDLSEGLEHTSYLGATSASLQINPSMGLLAYCDPLWRDESHFPAGRCYLQLLHNKNVRPRHELASFCKAGGKVTEPCMTGFSIDLLTKGSASVSFVDFLKSIHVVVGQPLAKGCGQAEILADPFYFPRTYTAYRPKTLQNTLPESYFGYSVAGEYISAVGESFKTSNEGNSLSQLTQLFKIAHLDGVLTAGGVEFDWQGQVDKVDSFTGFGTSMVNVKNIGGQDAVIVGAPYAAKGGRVYLYCVPNNLAVNNNDDDDDRRSVPTQSYNDFISAQEENDALGYSLTALGDIDGDGRETIAIGSPNLRDKEKSGRVYIVRILPNCTFDRRPVQVIQGPDKATYFGSVLPRMGVDLDFNNWPDLALPIPYCPSCSPMIYASRPHYQAVCRFYQPNWLNSVRIRRNIPIPIKLKIRLIPTKKVEEKNILQVLQSANVTMKDLVHQIIPDLWAKDPAEQRVRLSSFNNLKLNRYNNVLSLKFDLLPQMDVEDIPSLGQPDGDIRIQYRFNIPCPSNAKPIGNTNICSNGAWVNRPLIDWSKCSFQLRLTKFVCLPKGRCESDVFLRITDERSGKRVESESTTPTEETVLIYGDKENAFSQLYLDVFNKGPTFAGGVWIKMAFYGNLRFSALEVERREGNNGSTQFKPFACSHPQNNDSWVACNLGRLEFDPDASTKSAKRIRLTTFYVTNSNIDYSIPTYVNISVSSQTYDPQMHKNFVIWNYRLQHAPKYLITPGTHAPSSVIDNRTAPVIIGPSFHHRILVDEMGPRILHTFRVEYIGPTTYLENVTLRLYVPVKLEDKPKPLVYLFNEVRAPLANGIDMEWVSLRPKVELTGALDGVNEAYRCWYGDESLVNPNGWIGIDLNEQAVRRFRRELPTSPGAQIIDPLEWDYNGNYSNSIDAAAGRFNGKYNYQKVSFRRIPKEVIQCGRKGHKFGKPVCVEIYCRLSNLHQKRPVQVTVKGWLYAPTFFQYSTSDVEIVTSLTLDQGAVPKGVLRSPEPAGVFHMPQIFYFTKIKQAIFNLIPVWPIVVGLVLGILLLTFLVLLLYRFGFFRRRKHKLAVSGRRRWHENMENEANKRDADGPNGIDGDLDTFGSIRFAEEARRRRLRLRKHPEVVSILHPDEIQKETEVQGQDNPVAEIEPPTLHEENGNADAISPAPPQQQQPLLESITNDKPAADTMKVAGD